MIDVNKVNTSEQTLQGRIMIKNICIQVKVTYETYDKCLESEW